MLSFERKWDSDRRSSSDVRRNRRSTEYGILRRKCIPVRSEIRKSFKLGCIGNSKLCSDPTNTVMAEFQYLKELLSTGTGTEGSLLIPRKIYPTLIDEALKFLLPRELAALYIGPAGIPGSSIDINRMVENTLGVDSVAEGAEVPLNQVEYNNLNIKPRKFGVAIRITREMLEDANFNLLEHNVRIAGRRFAENENSLVITN